MAGNDLHGPTIRKEIGGTTYVITSVYSRKATETAVEKIRRLILKDAEIPIKKLR